MTTRPASITYTVKVRERLVHVADIEAATAEEAEDIAATLFKNGETDPFRLVASEMESVEAMVPEDAD